MKNIPLDELEQCLSLRLSLAACLALGAALGCAGVKPKNTTGGGGSGGGGGGTVIMPEICTGPNGLCTDFPTDPIVDPSAPANVTGMFGSTNGNGPCVTEPEDGSLFPNNWLRPRVHVTSGPGAYKITLHADKEANDLVAYTGSDSWPLPKDIWGNLARHVVLPDDVTVSVQKAGSGVTTVKFQVAPVGATGSMVFWAADPHQVDKMGVETMPVANIVNDSYLLGFAVGDESTVTALKVDQVAQPTFQQDGQNTRNAHCIGCHVGTPDGDYVAFVDAWPWPGAFAAVKAGVTGAALPNYVGASCTGGNNCTGSKTIVQYPWAGPFTFSQMHWQAGDRIAVVGTQLLDPVMPYQTDNWQPGRLAWVDTESTATTMINGQTVPVQGTAFGYLARSGDGRAAAFPTWSHNGQTIVYSSTVCTSPGAVNGCGMQDGRLSKGATDLYQIPYANKAGGNATAVPGASDPGVEEYYASFSPDDKLLIFNTVPAGQTMYANDNAELSVAFFGGQNATATKLAANTPPVCSGKSSPGVNNHWAKWAPDVTTANGKTFYFAIFSSNRYGLPTQTSAFSNPARPIEMSQLYITSITVDENGISSYPAIYLWNQPQDRINRTPAWEKFSIPPVP